MAVSVLSDPIPNYKFGLEIGGVLVAGFMSCSGFEVSRETREVVEGGINDRVHVLPGPLRHGHVTFQRGVTFTSFLWEWFHSGMSDAAVLRLPIVVFRYDVSGTPVNIWPLLDAYPVKWASQELRAGSREAAVESLEIAYGGSSGSGTAQRLTAEGASGPVEPGVAEGEAAGPGGDFQRELASRVFKLLKDTMRVERERAGTIGGY